MPASTGSAVDRSFRGLGDEQRREPGAPTRKLPRWGRGDGWSVPTVCRVHDSSQERSLFVIRSPEFSKRSNADAIRPKAGTT